VVGLGGQLKKALAVEGERGEGRGLRWKAAVGDLYTTWRAVGAWWV